MLRTAFQTAQKVVLIRNVADVMLPSKVFFLVRRPITDILKRCLIKQTTKTTVKILHTVYVWKSAFRWERQSQTQLFQAVTLQCLEGPWFSCPGPFTNTRGYTHSLSHTFIPLNMKHVNEASPTNRHSWLPFQCFFTKIHDKLEMLVVQHHLTKKLTTCRNTCDFPLIFKF